MDLFTTDLNYWAIIVATLAGMIVGALWYSPLMFSGTWLRLIGKTSDEIRDEGLRADGGDGHRNRWSGDNVVRPCARHQRVIWFAGSGRWAGNRDIALGRYCGRSKSDRNCFSGPSDASLDSGQRQSACNIRPHGADNRGVAIAFEMPVRVPARRCGRSRPRDDHIKFALAESYHACAIPLLASAPARCATASTGGRTGS